MKNWNVYRADGSEIVAVAYEIEYHGEYMGEVYLNVTFNSAKPIDFKIGDYIDYRGERFSLSVVPACKQQATSGSYGQAFAYENVKFNSVINELATCDFLDVVLSDNNIHWTALPTFSFYCEDVKALADRIQANLDRAYGENTWHVEVGDYDAFDEEINIDKQTIWDALSLVDTTFHTNFIIRGRHIYIGTDGTSVDHVFKCGVGNGLISLERTVDDSQKVVTRLRAYGNSTNLPSSYYRLTTMKIRAIVDRDYCRQTKLLPVFYYGQAHIYGDVGKCTVFVFPKTKNVHWATSALCYRDLQTASPMKYHKSNTPGIESYYEYDYNCSKNIFYISFVDNEDVEYPVFSFLDKYEEEENVVHWAIIETEKNSPFYDKISEAFKGTDLYEVRVRGYTGLNLQYISVHYGSWCELSKFPNNMAVNRLMLPFFPSFESFEKDLGYIDEKYNGYKLIGNAVDVYIDSPNLDKQCPIEGTLYIDGTDNEYTRADIYPSLEGATYDDAINAGFKLDFAGSRNKMLDEIAEDFTNIEFGEVDNGDPNLIGEPDGQVFVYLKDIGFDVNNYLVSGETAKIHMRSGMCVGREFDIIRCVHTRDNSSYGDYIYRLTISRKKDDNIGIYYPNSDFPILAGDKFCLLGIRMPEFYVDTASQRLLKESMKWFVNNDKTRFAFTPTIDNLWMARERRKKKAEGKEEESIYNTIQAGDLMMIESDDLGIGTSVRISSLTIKENSQSAIPEFDIQLQDKKSVGAIQRIQNKLEDYTNSGGGGLSYDQVKTVISDSGSYKFISKRDDDFAEGQITLEKGVIAQSSHNGKETAADGLIEYYTEEES